MGNQCRKMNEKEEYSLKYPNSQIKDVVVKYSKLSSQPQVIVDLSSDHHKEASIQESGRQPLTSEHNKSSFFLRQGKISIEEYVFQTDEKNQQNCLGSGNYRKVFKGYNSTTVNKDYQQVAIKINLIKNDDDLKLFREEASKQQLITSDHVVKILMSKEITYENERLFVVVQELMDNGMLKIPYSGYQHTEAIQIFKQILNSYTDIYRKGMAHRNLKPQNILTNNRGQIKITDFGSSIETSIQQIQQKRQISEYCSPQQGKNQEYTQKCDVYALGCILFELLVGVSPIKAGCANQSNQMNMEMVKDKLNEKKVPAEIVKFLEECLRENQIVELTLENGKKVEDPAQSRLSWEEVYLHPIFQKQFNKIALQVEGSKIFLTLNSLAQSNEVNIKQVLEKFSTQQSKLIKKDMFFDLLRESKVEVQDEDANRLSKILGIQDFFQISQLMDRISEVEVDHVSLYTPQEAIRFSQMFAVEEKSLIQQDQRDFSELIKEFKNDDYKLRQQFSLCNIKFTSFPLLPPMYNLQKIEIRKATIQVLEVRLDTPLLKSLNVINCQVEKILTIRGCPNLTSLNLCENKLRKLEGLQMLPKLVELRLDINRLTKISNVDHLKKLSGFSLSQNRISAIQGLQGCSSLQKIDIRYNRIRELSSLTQLKCLKSITQVDLAHNQVEENQENRTALQQFEQQHPKCSVSLQFSEVYQSQLLKDGKYRIVSRNKINNCIGEKYGKMALSNINIPESFWEFKQYKNDQYCIYFNHQGQKQIVGSFYYCYINQYKEDEKQQSINRYRWIIEKRGKDKQDRPLFSIKNVGNKNRMNQNYDGFVVLPENNDNIFNISQHYEKWKSEGRNLWYIVPV